MKIISQDCAIKAATSETRAGRITPLGFAIVTLLMILGFISSAHAGTAGWIEYYDVDSGSWQSFVPLPGIPPFPTTRTLKLNGWVYDDFSNSTPFSGTIEVRRILADGSSQTITAPVTYDTGNTRWTCSIAASDLGTAAQALEVIAHGPQDATMGVNLSTDSSGIRYTVPLQITDVPSLSWSPTPPDTVVPGTTLNNLGVQASPVGSLEVHFDYSTDNGATWSSIAYQLLANNSVAQNPLTVGTAGTIYLLRARIGYSVNYQWVVTAAEIYSTVTVVKVDQPLITVVNNQTITPNTAWTPSASGGAGSGAWQFDVAGQTAFPGTNGTSTGQTGTLLAGSNALSSTWTPTTEGQYYFRVRHLGDSNYNDSQPANPDPTGIPAGLPGYYLLNVVALPAITGQPVSQSVSAGSTVTFSVVATDSTNNLSYQWQRNGVDLAEGAPYSGTATSTLTITNAQTANAGSFTVVVKNSAGGTTSAAATLALNGYSQNGTFYIDNIDYPAGVTQPPVDRTGTNENIVAALNAPVTAEAGASVTYVVALGKQIRLEPGFHAKNGSVFHTSAGVFELESKEISPPAASDGSAAATVDSGFSFQVAASNATSFTATGLPPGVSINSATGELYGTPTRAGNYTVIVNASNDSSSRVVTITLNVVAGDSTSPGTLVGNLVIDNKGSANYAATLPLPPGRGGLQPTLGLQYNSNGGNGPLGIGFSLSTGYPQAITRGRSILARDGVVRGVAFDGSDKFYLDGKRLICVDGDYGTSGSTYRTEVDSFVTVTTSGSGSNIETFTVNDKTGLRMIFGKYAGTQDAYQAGGDETAGLAYCYALKRVEDSVGNYIEFDYTAAGPGEYVLSAIEYTGNSAQGVNPAVRVDLAYNTGKVGGDTSRHDASTSFIGLRRFALTQRLDEIKVSAPTTAAVAGIYDLGYEYAPHQGRTRLISVSAQLLDPSTNALRALPATTFQWSNSALSYTTTAPANNTKYSGYFDPIMPEHYAFGDVNGDGKDDYVTFNSGGVSVQLSNGTSFDAATDWGTPYFTGFTNTINIWKLADVNGDGKKDIIFGNVDANTGELKLWCMVSTGTGFVPLNGGTSPTLIYSGTGDFTGLNLDGSPGSESVFSSYRTELGGSLTNRIAIGDFTGDGRDDILIHRFDGKLKLLRNDGTSFAPNMYDVGAGIVYGESMWQGWLPNIEFLGYKFVTVGVSMMPCDLNGDGITDYVWTETRTQVDPSSGSEFSSNESKSVWAVTSLPGGGFSAKTSIMANDWELSQFNTGGGWNYRDSSFVVMPGDINGDGLTDFVVLYKDYVTPVPGTTDRNEFYLRVGVCLSKGAAGAPQFEWHYPLSDWTVNVGGVQEFPWFDKVPLSTFLNEYTFGSVAYAFPDKQKVTSVLGTSAGDGVALCDVNLDGRDDYVWYVTDAAHAGWWVMYALDSGFSQPEPAPLGWLPPQQIQQGANYPEGVVMSSRTAFDLKGDGLKSYTYAEHNVSEAPGIAGFHLSTGQRGDRIVAVHNGLGAATSVAYKPITDDSVYTAGAAVSYPIRELRNPTYVVSDVWRDGGTDTDSAHFSYEYSGRRLDLSGRGDLGFHSFITLDDQTQVFKYQFLAQSFPMTGLTAREQTYRYWTKDGATDFRLISSHDNTVVFDQVVKSAGGSTAWGTLYPFISRAVESRWEDANTAHFSTTAGGATSQSELLFPDSLPDGAHIQITAESLFDSQTEPQTTIPTTVGAATFYPSDLQNYAGTGLTGQYFDNMDLTGPAFTRVDSTIDFAWGTNVPDPRINPDTYSVRWTGHIVPRYDDQYTFTTTSDDGVRLWVNGQKLIDNWTDHARATDQNAVPITLTGGHEYDIQLEYYQNTGDSVVQLAWQGLNKQSYEVVPQSQLYPTATYVASGTNAPTGVTSYASIQSLGLPGNIYFGNLMSLKTDYGDGFTETVKTTYKTAPTDAPALTGLVDTVNTDVTSRNYGTQSAPTKTYTYFGSTPLVSTEKVSTGDPKLDTTTTYQRDDLGRVTETDISGYNDPNDPQSIGTYAVSSTPAQDFDTRFDLPTTIKNADPYLHTTKFTYDPTWGVPSSKIDANNAETTTTYDVYGRPLAVTDVLKGLVTHSEYRWTSSAASDWTKTQTVSPPTVDGAVFNGVASGASILGVAGITLDSAFVVKVTDTRVTSYIPNKPTVWTYYDRLGRVIRTIKENFNGETITDTAYNSLGQVIAVSNPYVAGATVYWTRTSYDALGRVATVAAPNGTVTTTTYQGRATITSVDAPNLGGIDPPAQVNATVVDAKGRTVKVWNPDPDTGAGPTFTDNLGDTATPPSITFDLDGFGRMRTTTLKDQTQTITADYNALGQQIALNDPDKGNWTYLPNALGQVVQQTDAKQNVTKTTFDHLGRQLTRTIQEANSGPQQTDSWFYYDVAATATAHPELNLVEQGTQGWIGSLERQETSTTGASGYAAANSDAKTIHYYNSLGLPSIDLTWADNHWFYTFTTYDADLRVQGLDYFWREPGYDDPSQNPQAWEEFGVTYNYNPRGYVTSVADTNATPRTWWQADPANGYDYLDRPVLFRKGSGNWTQRTYRTTDGVLTAIATGTSPGGNDLQNLSYNYDGLGNLTSRSGAGQSETLTYDSLNRLTSSTKQGGYLYFPNGNIRNKAVVGSQTTPDYGYDPNHPHAVQTAFGYTMGYDANGNLSSRTSSSETWDLRYAGFDKPRWMTKTTNGNVAGSEFLYDANHSRTVQLGYDQVDSAGVPSHYAWKRVYGLGPTLEANYQNDNNATGAPTWTLKKIRVYLPGPDGVVGTREFDPSLPQGQQESDWVYHYDHLGSIDVITPFGSTAVASNSSGQPGQYSEDAWGQRRNPATWSGPPTSTDTGGFNGLTPRGFTGHEMLDNLGLVHMNGRIYDPLLGRMLSADIVVQAPFSLQSYNRYSYVRNNPLTLTDPTGFIYDGIPYKDDILAQRAGRAIGKAIEPVVRNTRVQGGMKVVGAVGEGAAAVTLAATPEPTLLTKAAAVGIGGHAIDLGGAGLRQLFTGQETKTLTNQIASGTATKLGASPQTAAMIGNAADAAPAAASMAVGLAQMGTTAEATVANASPKPAPATGTVPAEAPATGVGKLHYYSPESLGQDVPHFSVETVGDQTLHTHQVITDSARNTTMVPVADSLPAPTATVQVELQNLEAAQSLQTARVGADLGTYSMRTNSCLTNAADVLRAGGAQIPQNGPGLRAWVRDAVEEASQ